MRFQTNTLIICVDEMSRTGLGCYGGLGITPHLDALANRGTRFTRAYTPSPICVPARAALHTGRHCHRIGAWDSVHAYDGSIRSWAHELRDAGRAVASIGKLHFRSREDDNGWSEEIMPSHIVNGIGWTPALFRSPPPPYDSPQEYAEMVGTGETDYQQHDRDVARRSCDWIKARAKGDPPWTLFASFFSPHYPLIAPAEWMALYADIEIPLPPCHARPDWPTHPANAAIRECFNYADHFDEERADQARRAYYALCSFVDDLAGMILTSLTGTGQAETTRVIFISDHGDSLGAHGFWAKSTMYEHSAGIPLIVAGPDVPIGSNATPVSLIDVGPSVLAANGMPTGTEMDGTSLWDLAAQPDDDRAVFSEYHDGGSITGAFMVRWQNWKYVEYPGLQPQLFNLQDDPDEKFDLGEDSARADIRAACAQKLREFVHPADASARAFADQATRIEMLGGAEAAMKASESFGFTPAGS